MDVEWGQVPRGRVWHLIREDGVTVLCNPSKIGAEFLKNLPPEGGSVCPRCEDRVNVLADVVRLAKQQEKRRPARNLSTQTVDSGELKH